MKNRLFIVFIFFLYFFTRLYNILSLPIFTDESIYIYWAKFIETSNSQWFISLTDGKPPLFIWMITLLLKIFPVDMYLFAGRFAAILAGFASFLGVYFLTDILFKSRKASFGAALLYIISPFTLLYDRLALFDSLLCATLIWSVYFAVKTAQTLSFKDAAFWGFFLGLAFLSKPPAILFWILTPFCVLALTLQNLKAQWRKIVFLIVIALTLSMLMNNSLRISSAYPAMISKNQQFQRPLADVLQNPFQLFEGNLNGLFSWVIEYYTLPVFLSGIFAFGFLLLKKIREGLVLMLLWSFPIVVFAIIGEEIFPRYIVFITPYFLIPLAYLIKEGLAKHIALKIATIIVTVLILISPLTFSYLLLTDIAKAPFPEIDYHQYISDHPSGYGLEKIYSFFDSQIKTNKITVVTQGTFGLYPYAFYLEYWNKDIRIIPRWPMTIDSEIYEAQKTSIVYVILKEYKSIPPELPLDLVFVAKKPGNRDVIIVTKLR